LRKAIIAVNAKSHYLLLQMKSATTTHSGAPQLSVELICLARHSSQRLADSLAAAGLTGPAFVLLDHLDQAGPSSQLELARILGVHPSNVVRGLDELEEVGLLIRRRDPRDRRRQVVGLTAKGGRKLEQARQLTASAEQDFVADLTPAEQRKLRSLLRRLGQSTCRRS
jgi:DNA-binding MarR family transcriptional regulator